MTIMTKCECHGESAWVPDTYISYGIESELVPLSGQEDKCVRLLTGDGIANSSLESSIPMMSKEASVAWRVTHCYNRNCLHVPIGICTTLVWMVAMSSLSNSTQERRPQHTMWPDSLSTPPQKKTTGKLNDSANIAWQTDTPDTFSGESYLIKTTS